MKYITRFGAKFGFILILFIGLFFRLVGIHGNAGLTYDELFVWQIINNSNIFDTLTQLINTDYHPPLYFISLYFFSKILGLYDGWLQLFSVIFSTSSLWIIYLIGKNLKTKTFGLLLMALMAFSFLFISEAQTVRFYQMGQFFALLSILFSIKLIKKPIKRNYIFLLLSNLALIYTQTTGLIFVALEILTLLAYFLIYKKENIKSFLKCLLYLSLFSLLQLAFLCIQIYNSKQTFWGTAWEWNGKYDIFNCIINNLFETIILSNLNHISFLIKILAICFVLLFGIYKFLKEKNHKFNFIFILFILNILAIYTAHTVGIINLYCNANYFLFISILFLITFAYLFSSFKYIFLCLIIALNLLTTYNTLSSIEFRLKLGQERFKTISNYVKLKKLDNIMIFHIHGDDILKKYLPQAKYSGIDFDKLFTMKNWQNQAKLVFDEDLENKTIKEKQKYIKKYLSSYKPSKALINSFNNAINKLDKDQYFLIINSKYRYIPDKNIKALLDNPKYSFVSKSFLISAKVANDIIELANKNHSLKHISTEIVSEAWIISVYQKIR